MIAILAAFQLETQFGNVPLSKLDLKPYVKNCGYVVTSTLPDLPTGYEPLTDGSGAYGVAINVKVRKEITKKARAEQRAELEALIKAYSRGGPTEVPSSKFNGSEGWYPSARARNKIRLEAFKPRQLRAYGFCRSFHGRPYFFITGVDVAKKQDEASQRVLDSSGSEAVRLNAVLGE